MCERGRLDCALAPAVERRHSEALVFFLSGRFEVCVDAEVLSKVTDTQRVLVVLNDSGRVFGMEAVFFYQSLSVGQVHVCQVYSLPFRSEVFSILKCICNDV